MSSEFKKWVKENYEIESLDTIIQETRKRNGTISTKVGWNPHRFYPEVGDYVTNVSALFCCDYVGKVIKRSKGKRPKYDIEILYSYEKHEKQDKTDIEGYFLAKVEKKDNWKIFK